MTVERKDIAALLQSLCEHPLADCQAQSSPEVEALRRAAAQAFREDSAARGEGSDANEATRLRAALAALMSGTAGEGERRIVADAVLQSPAARLDVQSALAFVGAIEHSPQAAPARLVDEILARDRARSTGSVAVRERAGSANIWSLIVGRSWSARGWRVAAVCTVLLMVSVAPVYRMQTNPAVEGGSPSPMVETSSKPSAVVDVPAQPQSTLACAPRGATGEAIKAQNIAPADAPTPAISTAAPDCGPTTGRTFADHRPKRSRQSPRAIGQRRHGRPPARAMPPRSAPRAPTTRPMAA